MSVIRQQHKRVVCPHHYHHLQQTAQNSATSITNEAEIAANHSTELNDSDTELNDSDTVFNDSDTEFNDSDTELVDHYVSLIQSIQRGDAELQPLPLYDITNVLPPQEPAPMNRKDSKASILFRNCQATIHNCVSS